MKTTLTIDIDYDPKSTDPEALACAMDRLLETALSIPGVVDEYGNPRMGEFLVAEAQGRNGRAYTLRIHGPKLREQRRLLERLLDREGQPAHGDDRQLLDGIVELLDEIADQAHDLHGIDCLEPEEGSDER